MKSPPDRTIAPLDGLRGLAILLVMWCHMNADGFLAGMNIGPIAISTAGACASSGVILFFILSGFLLFLPYARSLLGYTTWPATRTFYWRRVLRILPAYYVVLIVLMLWQGVLLGPHPPLGSIVLLALLLQDWQPAAFSLGSQLNGPFWSLTVEWQFYLVLPLLALGIARVAGAPDQRWFWARIGSAFLLLIGFGLSVRVLATYLHYDGGYQYPSDAPGVVGLAMRLLYGVRGRYLEVFALGMAASVAYVFVIEQQRLPAAWKRWLGSISLLGALFGLVGFWLWRMLQHTPPVRDGFAWVFPPNGRLEVIWSGWFQGVCYCLLLLGILFGGPLLQALFSWLPLRRVGTISYSLYLWHFPLVFILAGGFSGSLPFAYLRYVLICLLILALLGTASYYYIERPFLRWRRTKKLPFKPAVAIQ